jgi:hypothetical protein
MKFLFATLQHVESDFYGRVGRDLKRRGHDVAHLTYSRRAAMVLRRKGDEAYCLPDLMKDVRPAGSWDEEAARIVAQYPIPSLHEVYRTDLPCRDNPDDRYCVERTVRHFLAIERLFERLRPDMVVPEVGNESIREVAHLVGTGHSAKTLFLMYTIFDDPLRLYADTMDAPIVAPEEIRPLSTEEEAELDDFIRRYMARNVPSREYREVAIGPHRAGVVARHFAVRALWDRDNDYLRPAAWVARDLGEVARGRLARGLYAKELPDRPFVYFPLQVADDYKILKLRPHCVRQEAIVEQVAAALPPGVDLVVKEHPMSIGRNPLGMLRRLSKAPHIHLLDPRQSSLELARTAAGVATISSSVGLEALLCDKPVLTLATPFYAGYGVTLDVEDLREISEKVPELLGFSPDRERSRRFLHAAMRRCYPGAPVLVDSSDENASRLADTLARVASGEPASASPVVATSELSSRLLR